MESESFPRGPRQGSENPLQLGVLYLSLGAICLAPFAYGAYPPWISGFAVAAMCALGIIHVILAWTFGTSWFPVPRSVAIPAYLLLGWLCLMTLRDAELGTAQNRFPALSARVLPYAFAFLAAGMLGAGFGTLKRFMTLLVAVTALGSVLAFFTLAEWHGFHVKSYLKSPLDRPSGILINPNRFAVMESLCVSCGLALFMAVFNDPESAARRSNGANGWGRERPDIGRLIKLAVLGISLVAMAGSLVLTLSRLTILTFGLGLGIAVFLWMRRSHFSQRSVTERSSWEPTFPERVQRMMYWGLPVIVVLGWGVWAFTFGSQALSTRYSQMNSAEGRFAALKAARPLFDPAEAKLFGHGLGSFEYVFTGVQPASLFGRWTRLHSDWLQLALEAGIPALVLALALTVAWCVKALKSAECRVPSAREQQNASSPAIDVEHSPLSTRLALLSCFPLAGIFTALVCSGADFPLRETGVALVFFALAGALVSTNKGASGTTPVALDEPAWKRPAKAVARAILAVAVMSALAWSGWMAGRNAYACASSPWYGQVILPVKVGSDPAAWARATSLDPGDPQLHYFAAWAADTAKQPPRDVLLDGLNHARIAASLSPRDYLVPWVAASLCEKLGMYPECEAYHQQVIDLYPANYAVREDAGLFYLRRKVRGLQTGNWARIAAVDKAREYFRFVVQHNPEESDRIATWMEENGCTSDEVALLWEGDGATACLARSRYLGSRGLWQLAARALVPIIPSRDLDPSRDLAGKRDTIWYHTLLGKVEFDRDCDEQGIAEWRLALSLNMVRDEQTAYSLMVLWSRDLSPDCAERVALALADQLNDAPAMVRILAEKLSSAGRYFSVCRLLEKTAGDTDYLCRIWAEAALRIDDFGTAQQQANKALRFGPSGSETNIWYSEFTRKLSERKSHK